MRGLRAAPASSLSVYSPMPLVPPTKTATMVSGSALAMRALDACTAEYATIFSSIPDY